MKKGMADTNKQLYWTIFLVPLVSLFAFLILYVVPESIDIKSSVSDRVQDILLQDKILSSKECLGYEENGNVKTGFIDKKKFNQQTINTCLRHYEIKRGVAFILIIQGEEKEEILYEFNPDRRIVTYKKPIILVDNDKKQNGMLEIRVPYN